MFACLCAAGGICIAGETVDGGQALDVEGELAGLVVKMEAEKKRLLESQISWAAELGLLRSTRRDLASRVLELELERGRLAVEAERLAQTLRVEREKEKIGTKAIGDVYDFAKMTAEEINIFRREQPVGLLQMETNSDFIASFGEAGGATGNDVIQLVELIGQIHDEAGSIGLGDQLVRGPDGIEYKSKVIQVGHVGAYYLIEGSNRVAVALDSPSDASGFRWNEDLLSLDESGQIIQSVDILRGSAPTSIELPIDVTTALRETDLAHRMGISEWFRSGGLVMYPLAGVAILAFGMVAHRLWFLNREGRGGSSVAQMVIAMCRQGQVDQAVEQLERHRGVVPRTLHACLVHRDHGQNAMEDRIQEQLLYEMPHLQRFLGGIAVLGAVAPLLGLLGTVTGIIQTFGVIKHYGDTDPGMLAGGISEALVTTASGLVIAIPILLLHGVLRSRVERVISDAEKHAATVLNFLTVENSHAVPD